MHISTPCMGPLEPHFFFHSQSTWFLGCREKELQQKNADGRWGDALEHGQSTCLPLTPLPFTTTTTPLKPYPNRLSCLLLDKRSVSRTRSSIRVILRSLRASFSSPVVVFGTTRSPPDHSQYTHEVSSNPLQPLPRQSFVRCFTTPCTIVCGLAFTLLIKKQFTTWHRMA